MTDDEHSERDARAAGTRLVAAHPSEDPFAAAFKATRMPMIITDPRQQDNPIIFVNHAFIELTGYSDAELIGKNCRLLQGPETDPEAISNIRKAVAEEKSLAIDILNYRKDGSTFWNALFVSPVSDESGEVIYFFASQLDFTNIKSQQAELARARHFAEQEVTDRTRDLEQALQAKTVLVHEVDHRVKNNLATIASIVKLQTRMSEDETVKRTLRSVLNRVEALSTVQRKLLATEEVGRFDVADLARELVFDMVGALQRNDIMLTTDLHSVFVPAVKAPPLALVLNETIGDAVRRGLSDGGGEIHVEVRRLNGRFLIKIVDTVTPVSVDKAEQDFSLLMLDTCSRQLGATIERNVEGHRTEVSITLMVEEAEE